MVCETFFKVCDVPSKNIKYLIVSISHMNYFSYLDMISTTTYSNLRTTGGFSNLLQNSGGPGLFSKE